MQRKEKKDFILSDAGLGVREGYPILKDLGVKLKIKGVNFFDASMVYKNFAETAYSDSCCHLSDEGEKFLSDFIVSRVDVR